MPEPITARIIIGIRIASAWMAMMNPGIKDAAASELIPISKRSPLTAMTAAHALCKRMKPKLVMLMSQEPFCPRTDAGNLALSVTTG